MYVATAGQTTYQAKGILETEQETIIATRNATIVQQSVSQTTSTSASTSSTRITNVEVEPLPPSPTQAEIDAET